MTQEQQRRAEILSSLSDAAHDTERIGRLINRVMELEAQATGLGEALRQTPCQCVYGIPDPKKIPAYNLLWECVRCAALSPQSGTRGERSDAL